MQYAARARRPRDSRRDAGATARGRVSRGHTYFCHAIFMVLDKLDLSIIALYLAGITLFGLRFRKQQRSLRE